MTKSLRTLAIAALIALHVMACAGDDDSAAVPRCCPEESGPKQSSAEQLQSCDPLQADEQPIMLDNVIAVGRDDQGVLYVLDDPEDSDYQVFVSEHDALQRHRVLGSGSGDSMWISVSVEADPQFGLYVTLDASGEAASMRRFDSADVKDKSQEPEGDDLDLLDQSAIEDMKLRNLSPEVAIEYSGTIEDGRRVLVVRPNDDWSYEDFRVFLGTPQKMLEREVKSVLRAKDGGSTTIDFMLDGEPATLRFPVVNAGDHIEPGDSTLASDGETLSIALEKDPDPTTAGALKFFCR